jgi:transposase
MAYSLDLRERVVAAVKEGMTQPEVAARFKVSLSSVERYVRREREGALQGEAASWSACVSCSCFVRGVG